MTLRRTALAAIAIFAATSLSTVNGQVLRKGAKDRPETPAVPGAAAPAAPTPGETAGQTRREGRQEAREARQDARAVGEAGPQARQTARDTRQMTRQNIQATRAADFGLWFNTRATNGLVISDLTNNGMFATAGFREGDQIVSINGQPVTTEAQFVQYLSGPNIGTQPVQIVVIRGGQQQTLVLQPNVLTEGVVAYDPLYQYGIVIDDSNPNQIVILRVFPRTPAYYAGLRTGDVITTVGGQRITSVNMLTQAFTNADAALPLQITRAGQTRDIQLDASGAANANVRTALRPDFDAGARTDTTIDGRAQPGAARAPDSATAPQRTPDSTTAPARTPDTGAPRTPDTGTAPRTPDATAPPRTPDANAPQAAPRERPDRPTPPSGTTPATPATPARPGVAPATPATPATPAPNTPKSSAPAPAKPKAGTTAPAATPSGTNNPR